jgi:RNA polymerase sigma-70 factor (ECF subfamily)
VAESIVIAARRGDDHAFARIVEHYDARLRMLAFQVLRDRDAMDDALQDAYVSAFRALPQFRGDAALSSWLYRIVYNACLALARRRSPQPLDDAEGADLAFGEQPDPFDAAASRSRLAAALAKLPSEQRAVVVLVLWDGLGYESAAHVLGVPVGTVSSRLTNARVRLRRLLTDSEEAGRD